DPDCDRVGIACMTENGPKLLNGNQIGCILLHYILSQKKERGELPANAAAVTTIVSTEMARAIADDYGCKLIKVLTGFKYIAEQIHIFETTGCNTFMFGFEESYGYLSGTDVRDKDGVNACMLIAEAASWYKKMYGKTLADAIDMLYEKYGYYGDKVTSFVLPGKDGLEKMQHTMAALRDNTPADFAGEKVVAVRDYLTSVRTTVDGQTETLTLPKSNVVYFELENGSWICVRPSGTEPKIKLYVNAVSRSDAKTRELLNAYSDAAVKLLESL
ncbi:MAG: phospho-sugar mutase, partial [Clostridia bacterium]|nr:phospho-sugar mutase [Clostridia bacterium]